MGRFSKDKVTAMTIARANKKKIDLTNERAANCLPEIAFSPFRALSRPQQAFPFCC